ncbi:Phthiocerol synthesis polyketide synthase type I PpsC [compost metagenome]
MVGLTAWQVLVDRARLSRGQKVLIHAGSGGVGTFAIQLAKQLGAKVATTASAANADLVRSLGADVVIDYKTEDFAQALSGYDVVLSSLDAETLERSVEVLKPGGKLISISAPPDPAFAKAQGLNPILQLVLRLLSRKIRRKAAAKGADYSFLFMRGDGNQLQQITALVEAGVIRPVVDRTFSFAELNAAFAYIETGRAKGKVVVTVKNDAQ